MSNLLISEATCDAMLLSLIKADCWDQSLN